MHDTEEILMDSWFSMMETVDGIFPAAKQYTVASGDL
jgi:hypothetical protein